MKRILLNLMALTLVFAQHIGAQDISPSRETPVAAAQPEPNPSRMIILAGSESGQMGGQDGLGTAARFKFPTGVAADAQGTLFVADNGNQTIRKVTYGQVVTTFAGSMGVPGVVNATGTQAQFVDPMRVVLDKNGNCYVSDNASLMRVISPVGSVTTLVGSTVIGLADGIGAIARFANPHGLAVDNQGSMYVADTGNNAIRKVIISSATVSTQNGTTRPLNVTLTNVLPVPVYTVTTGDSVSLKTNATGAAQWLKDDVIIAGAASTTLSLPPSVPGQTPVLTATVTGTYQVKVGGVVVGKAKLLFVSEGGPQGVALDSRGAVYTADFGHNVIVKGSTILAGQPNIPGYVDGIEQAVQFNGPSDLVVDTEDNIYVADTNNNAVRKITPYGQVSTVIATVPPANAVNFGDAPVFITQLNRPSGLAIDTVGNLYIADTGNHRIWRFVLTPTSPKVKAATEVTSYSFTANWETVPGVTLWAHPTAKFIFNLATDPEFLNIIKVEELAGDKLSLAVTGLTANQSYYYRVAAKNEGGTGLFSTTIKVVALLEPTALPPTAMAANLSGGSTALNFTLNWSTVPDVTSYEVDMATDAEFKTMVTGFRAQKTPNTTLPAVGLSHGTYYYRVRALYPITGSQTPLVGGNSNVITVKVLPPPEATPASDISAQGFTANWNTVPQAAGYVLDVATDAAFGSLVSGYAAKDVGSATSTVITGLKAGAKYFYRIRASLDETGVYSTPSAPSNTISPSLALAAPEALAATGLGSTASSIEFTANWKVVEFATAYLVDVSLDADFRTTLSNYSNLNAGNTTSLRVTGLAEKTTYYYRVRATASVGPSAHSNVISTKTQAMSTSETIKEAVGGGKGGGAPSPFYLLALALLFLARNFRGNTRSA